MAITVDALSASAPEIRAAAERVRAFAGLLRRGDPADLEPWLEVAAATGLRGFATGLRQGSDAVRAAITKPWSKDEVEKPLSAIRCYFPPAHG